MRILFLTHSFNSLTQRLFAELTERGHEVSIEFDIHPEVSIEAVALYQPDLVIAPFLKRAVPEAIWRHTRTLIVHPGIKGDRGPSSLDWAIMEGQREWGVTVLEANAEMDAGDVWATVNFPMRDAPKASLYRNEVTDAAVAAVLEALERIAAGKRGEPLEYGRQEVHGRWHPPMQQGLRAIDWQRDDTATVMRKIHAADGSPGVRDLIDGRPMYLYGAHREEGLSGTRPGAIIAQRDGAICRATVDGAVWITHLRLHADDRPTLKLPAAMLLQETLQEVPEIRAPLDGEPASTSWREIRYEEANGVGYLHFDFYNGAMSAAQCRRLLDAWCHARGRNTRVIVLMGGREFWSNGIHLNVIEAADSPADASWDNINAMDDLAHAILTTDSHLTVAAMQGNAGAGGVYLALAADVVHARRGVILNPHYKNMGNLYGSEFWTYLLPRRVGPEAARDIMQHRLPLSAAAACRQGLIDDCIGDNHDDFRAEVRRRAELLAHDEQYLPRLAEKRERRRKDEQHKPLEQYRREELERMRLNFYGFDPSYHVARYNFVYKVGHSWTPLHLALHRRPACARPTMAATPV